MPDYPVFQRLQTATDSLISEPIALLVLVGFLLWGAIFDIRTLKITNRFNKIFFLTGLGLMGVHLLEQHFGFPAWLPSLSFGWGNVGGAAAGFLFLFIPAFIKAHPMGGDIKMVAAIGFWLGFTPMLFVLLAGTALNALYWFGAFTIWKEFGSKTLMPFAPFFALGVFVVYGSSYFV